MRWWIWLLLLPEAAAAELRLCNPSFDVVNVAFARDEGAGFRSRGWWRVGPNQCAVLDAAPLRTRYVYIFAMDLFGNEVLNGATPMCIAPRRFQIEGREDCLLRGYVPATFVEVDTQNADDWVIHLVSPGL